MSHAENNEAELKHLEADNDSDSSLGYTLCANSE